MTETVGIDCADSDAEEEWWKARLAYLESEEESRRAQLASVLAAEGSWSPDLQNSACHISRTDRLSLAATQAAATGDTLAVAENVALACETGCAAPPWTHQAFLTPAQITTALESLDPDALLRDGLLLALVHCAQLAVDLGNRSQADRWLTAFPTHERPRRSSRFTHGGLCDENWLDPDQTVAAVILLDRAIGNYDRSRMRAEACLNRPGMSGDLVWWLRR